MKLQENKNLVIEPTETLSRAVMAGKPVLYRENTRTVITDPSPKFGEKLLCDSLVFNLADSCAFSCAYCYVEAQMRKLDKPIIVKHNEAHKSTLGFQDVVIRRRNALQILESQLLRKDGSLTYSDPDDKRVIYSSTLVDVAANMELLRETAAACLLISSPYFMANPSSFQEQPPCQTRGDDSRKISPENNLRVFHRDA